MAMPVFFTAGATPPSTPGIAGGFYFWFDTSVNIMKFWNGSIWQGLSPSTTGSGYGNLVQLSSPVVNNNASANTMQDVTGLSFPVVAGTRYRFRATIPYTAQATTTGSRWSVSGPASPTMLAYRSRYPLTATTETVNPANSAYDTPAGANASSLAAGNVAIIEGMIVPSASGTVTIRFASEIANSAITALAGASLEWW